MLNLRGVIRVVLTCLYIIVLAKQVWISKSPNENEHFKEFLTVDFIFIKAMDNSGHNLRYIMDNELSTD